MSKKVTKKDVISSLFWKGMESGGTQVVNFVISIILARLLSPSDYGTMALIVIFINLSNVFIQAGFNTALIQKKNPDDLDYSTVFYSSLILAGILYTLLFWGAPYIAEFYNKYELINVLRILAITLFFGSINSIQIAIISKKMQFKTLFYRSCGAIIISGVIGVIVAYNGFGIWALVAQQLTNQIISTIIMWFTVKWRPKVSFSFERLKELLSFGWKILISNLMNTIFLNIRDIIVGKIYNSQALGYFNRGKQFPSLIITNIDGTIQSVMLPAYSSHQDDKKKVRDIIRKSIKTSSFLTFPLMIGMAVVAEPLVIILLGEKWIECVPFLKIFCLTYMLMPLHTSNLQAIQGMGYSTSILKIEVVKRVIEIIVLVVTLYFGIYAIAFGTFITSIISLLINSYPNIKLLNYGFRQQLMDVVPALILSIAMGGIVRLINFIPLNIGLTLILQVIVGIIVYIGLAFIFKIDSFKYLLGVTRSFIRNKR